MKAILVVLGVGFSLCLYAQELSEARKLVDTLASPSFHGRGYVQGGDSLAAAYLGSLFDQIGLRTLNGGRFQSFEFPVNTFPGRMLVKVNGKKLQPGLDYILHPASKGIKGRFRVVYWDSSFIAQHRDEVPTLGRRSVPAYRFIGKLPPNWQKKVDEWPLVVKVMPSKLTFSVAQHKTYPCKVEIAQGVFPKMAKKLKVDIENVFVPRHKARNVVGYLEGTTRKDSFLIVSAHYDHLGHLGHTAFFPGANDNASGVSMLLQLARYYSQPANRLPYSILFVAFAGEEAGLVGSTFFTEHPLVPLSTVRFVLNLDLLGSGKEGITVVNGTIFKKEFALLDSLNKQFQWFGVMKARGRAANSDHYPFSEKGVPAFFVYTMGEITAYHDVHDTAAGVTFSRYKEVAALIVHFFEALSKDQPHSK